MAYGLIASELQVILEILQKIPQIDEAILFGSRAMGREKKGSDIDIALKGEHVESIVSTVSYTLNSESPLPYYFDIESFKNDSCDSNALEFCRRDSDTRIVSSTALLTCLASMKCMDLPRFF